MAEPVFHDAPTNPCRMCDGERTVLEKSWAVPHCWVICSKCGNSAGAHTIPEVLTVWNDENTPVKGPASASAV